MTTCEVYWDLISADLDGVLTEEESKRLNAHLKQCPECAKLQKDLQAMRPDFAGIVMPGNGFTDRIMAGVAKEKQDIPFTNLDQNRTGVKTDRSAINSWWKPIKRWGALAACLVLILVAGKAIAPRFMGSSASVEEENSAYTDSDAAAEADMDSTPVVAEEETEPAAEADMDSTAVVVEEETESAAGKTEDIAGNEAAAAEEESIASSGAMQEEVAVDSITIGDHTYYTDGETVEYLPGEAVYEGNLTEGQTDDTELEGMPYYTDGKNSPEVIYTGTADSGYMLWYEEGA